MLDNRYMTTLVFANGDIETYDWLSPYLERATVVIAADGGTRHLLHLGRRPDVIIGDLDSFPDAAQPWLEDEAVEIVLSDIGLPDMSGYQLAQRIRAEERWRDLHLIALTGFGQAADRKRAMEAGFDAHLTTPVTVGKEMQYEAVAVADLLLESNGRDAVRVQIRDPNAQKAVWLNAFELSQWADGLELGRR